MMMFWPLYIYAVVFGSIGVFCTSESETPQ